MIDAYCCKINTCITIHLTVKLKMLLIINELKYLTFTLLTDLYVKYFPKEILLDIGNLSNFFAESNYKYTLAV